MELKAKALFNAQGDIDVRKRRMINGNTTNLNDFNHMKYQWVHDWYRQAMNNFWIPEEINLTQDVKDYRLLKDEERQAYDKILSFLVFLDSLQTANLPHIGEYITANEINLCLTIQAFQEAVHSQSYSYMLDTICSPDKRDEILYQWKYDEHLLKRNQFIGEQYNDFLQHKDHLRIKSEITQLKSIDWLITYDACPEILELYCEQPCKRMSWNYSAANKRTVDEVIIFKDTSMIPSEAELKENHIPTVLRDISDV